MSLQCPMCRSQDLDMPPPEAPDADAVCNGCSYRFGPQCPDPHIMNKQSMLDFIEAVPGSAPYFTRYLDKPMDKRSLRLAQLEALEKLYSTEKGATEEQFARAKALAAELFPNSTSAVQDRVDRKA